MPGSGAGEVPSPAQRPFFDPPPRHFPRSSELLRKPMMRRPWLSQRNERKGLGGGGHLSAQFSPTERSVSTLRVGKSTSPWRVLSICLSSVHLSGDLSLARRAQGFLSPHFDPSHRPNVAQGQGQGPIRSQLSSPSLSLSCPNLRPSEHCRTNACWGEDGRGEKDPALRARLPPGGRDSSAKGERRAARLSCTRAGWARPSSK